MNDHKDLLERAEVYCSSMSAMFAPPDAVILVAGLAEALIDAQKRIAALEGALRLVWEEGADDYWVQTPEGFRWAKTVGALLTPQPAKEDA